MNLNSKNILIALGVLVLAGSLVTAGFFWGGVNRYSAEYGPGMMWQAENGEEFVGGYGPSMMGQNGQSNGMMGGYAGNSRFAGNYGPGMMGDYAGADCVAGGYGHGRGMMGSFPEGYSGDFDDLPCQTGEFDGQGAYGPGMMWGTDGETWQGGYGAGMMGGARGQGRQGGMIGGYGWQAGEIADPLSIEENEAILEGFLADNGWSDQLEIAEIMIFDNHAYAQLVEIESGIGAYEVLIDAGTGSVYPEHGANMMWNLKYGMHSAGVDVSATMDISAEQAVTFAQEYLDANLAGTTADDHAVPFYGYYTLHVLQDGEIVGMLSVEGFSGEVLLHTWHGDLIEMSEHLHE